MIYLEPIGSGGPSICRGCGAPAALRILFAIGLRVKQEHVDLCDDCVIELSKLAEARGRMIEMRREFTLKG